MRKAATAHELPGTGQVQAKAAVKPAAWLELATRLRPYLYLAPAMICFLLFFFLPDRVDHLFELFGLVAD